jgi:hypothetical protein
MLHYPFICKIHDLRLAVLLIKTCLLECNTVVSGRFLLKAGCSYQGSPRDLATKSPLQLMVLDYPKGGAAISPKTSVTNFQSAKCPSPKAVIFVIYLMKMSLSQIM